MLTESLTKRNGYLLNLNMESKKYLSKDEALSLRRMLMLVSISSEWSLLDEIGLQWNCQNAQYHIVNKKLWLFGKIKYGI